MSYCKNNKIISCFSNKIQHSTIELCKSCIGYMNCQSNCKCLIDEKNCQFCECECNLCKCGIIKTNKELNKKIVCLEAKKKSSREKIEGQKNAKKH